MSGQEVALVCAFVAAVLFVGLGFAAFWPSYPPVDDTPLPEEPKRPRRYRGRQRPTERLDGPEVPLPPERIDLAGALPLEPTAESWMWSTGERRAMHRFEHVGEGTQPIRWPLPPEEDPGPPEWPPWQPR